MSNITEAINKIVAEVNNTDNKMIQYIGEALIDTLTEGSAGKILQADKTITGALSHMKDLAKKNQRDGVSYFDPKEGMEIIEKYFGILPEDKHLSATITEIKPAEKSMNVDLMSLL